MVVAIEISPYGGDSKRNQARLSRLVSATVWYSFILVHPMIVEVITSVFPLRLGNTEVLLLVDAPGQSVSRDLAFLPHWSFSRYAAQSFGGERVSRNDDWGKKGLASLAVFLLLCFR